MQDDKEVLKALLTIMLHMHFQNAHMLAKENKYLFDNKFLVLTDEQLATYLYLFAKDFGEENALYALDNADLSFLETEDDSRTEEKDKE